MAHQVILVPAYGRVYANKESAIAAWHAGKDFRIAGGSYCSIRDIDTLKRLNNHVLIKYSYAGFSEIIAV